MERVVQRKRPIIQEQIVPVVKTVEQVIEVPKVQVVDKVVNVDVVKTVQEVVYRVRIAPRSVIITTRQTEDSRITVTMLHVIRHCAEKDTS